MADARSVILRTTDPTRSLTEGEFQDLTQQDEVLTLPFVPMRGVNVFPNVHLTFDVGRQGSSAAVKEATDGDQLLFLTSKKDPLVSWPDYDDLHTIGTIAKIVEVVENSGHESRKVTVKGLIRARLLECQYSSETPRAIVQPIFAKPMSAEDEDRLEARRRELMKVFQTYAVATGRISADASLSLQMLESASDLTDLIASQLFVEIDKKQELLNMVDVSARMGRIAELLLREIRIHQYEEEL